MMLLTKKHRERLLRNGRNRDQDHVPVVNYLNILYILSCGDKCLMQRESRLNYLP